MSYARFSRQPGESRPSDVYVFMHIGGWLECCDCQLSFEDGTGDHFFHATSTAAMIAHLAEHSRRGHHVPEYVVPDLEADDAENFPDRQGIS